MTYKFINKNGRNYFLNKRTDGTFYRVPIDLIASDRLRIEFEFSDEAPESIITNTKERNGEIVYYYDKFKIMNGFARNLETLIVGDCEINMINRNSDKFGMIEVSYYNIRKNIGDGFYLGNLNLYPIEEEVDINGNLLK